MLDNITRLCFHEADDWILPPKSHKLLWRPENGLMDKPQVPSGECKTVRITFNELIILYHDKNSESLGRSPFLSKPI